MPGKGSQIFTGLTGPAGTGRFFTVREYMNTEVLILLGTGYIKGG